MECHAHERWVPGNHYSKMTRLNSYKISRNLTYCKNILISSVLTTNLPTFLYLEYNGLQTNFEGKMYKDLTLKCMCFCQLYRRLAIFFSCGKFIYIHMQKWKMFLLVKLFIGGSNSENSVRNQSINKTQSINNTYKPKPEQNVYKTFVVGTKNFSVFALYILFEI